MATDALGRYDLHAHTNMSDGDLTLQEVVELAAERGVTIGIADHVSTRNRTLFVSSVADVQAYLAALSDAPVLRSAEFCWCDPFYEDLPPELTDRLDYTIGSNHGFALPDGTMASPWWKRLPRAWQGREEELMDVMVQNLCDLVTAMPVQIVAHPTLTPAALLDREPDVMAWWTEDREDRFIEAVVDSGVAIEISNRYRLPHDRLLAKARQAGATFTLGSDGHNRDQLARLDWAVDAARRAGIGSADLYVPERALALRGG